MNDKLKGCIYGLFVGDALATPYEYRNADYMSKLTGIDMVPPQGHQRTYKEVKTGTWSDEGAMTLAMMDTIVKYHSFKPKHYLNKQKSANKKLADFFIQNKTVLFEFHHLWEDAKEVYLAYPENRI